MSMNGYVQVSAVPCRGQRRELDPLELVLVVVSPKTWVLETELGSFARAVLAANLQACSPASLDGFLIV